MFPKILAADPPTSHASAEDFNSKIEELLSRFKSGLTKDEQEEIENISLEDLQEAIKKIQEKQRATRTYRNLKRIEPFVTGMTEYGKVVAVFANSVPVVAFVWLKTASNYTDAFDLLLDAYQDIGNNLPQFKKYAQLFGSKPSVRKVLVEVFEGILRFHKRAIGFFRRSAWKRLFRASWGGFKRHFSDILTELKKHQALLEREGHLMNFENVIFMMKDLEIKDEQDQQQKLVDTYKWLSAADYSSDHNHLLSQRSGFPGTRMWLLQRRDMISWLDSSSEVSIFWLHGILGSGKTIAASCVSEELVLKNRGMSSISVAYFYCKDGDAARDSCDGIFRAILAQLLEQNRDIVPYLNSHRLVLTHDPLKSAGLKALVETIFGVLGLVYLVIDGLDEIDRSERKEFFNIILPLVKSQLRFNEDVGSRIKLFISSRGEDDIRTHLDSIGRTWRKSYGVTKDDNHKDIASYVSFRVVKELQNKFRLEHSRKEEIYESVCSRAGAKLILDNLMNQTTLEELEEELNPDILPSGLRDAYGRIFRHLNKYLEAKKQAKSREILGLMGFSKRSLKTNDIQGALSIDTSNRTLDYKARCLMPDAASALRELCSVIVEVRSDQSVGFIHTTARQFVRQLYIRDPESQNFRLTDLCLTYLTFDCLKPDIGEDKVQQSTLNGDYSFLEYAANNWLNHLRDLESDRGRLDPERYCDIRAKTKAVLDLHQPSRAQDYTPTSDVVQYFHAFSDWPEIYLHPALRDADHVDRKLIKEVRGDSTSIDTHPRPFLMSSQLLSARKALELAITSHEAENLAFLRECYGPISFKCSVVGCLRYDLGFTEPQERDDHVRSHNRPFKCPERGCFYGDVGFAEKQTLDKHISLCHLKPDLDKFIFPNLGNSRLPTEAERERFWEAIRSEDLDLVRDLIHIASSPVGKGPLAYTALQYAAKFGKVGSAKLLLDFGSSIGAVNKHGSALNVACSSGQAEMVRFLLSRSRCKEDMDSRDKRGNTPLLSTLRSSRDAKLTVVPIVKMLLEHDGIDPDAKDNDGRTLLSWAASRGVAEVIKVLLGHGVGVDVNARDRESRTPLSFAAARMTWGAVSLVKMFLEHGGVDPDARDNEGRTPLSWAASSGVLGVAKAILEHGVVVDVNAKDKQGRTPLSLAAGRIGWGVVPLVKMLLEHGGIDPDAKDNEGRTPLSWAARSGVAEVVNVFLEHGVGVDVNAKDSGGRTPLSRAADRTDSEAVPVVKKLLEHGGIDPDAKGHEGRTPLSWATSGGVLEVVEAFLGHDVVVDVNAKDSGGRTPLSRAADRADSEAAPVVKMLLEHDGIDPDTRDNEGRTPLSWAASNGIAEVVQVFLKHGVGVDVNAADSGGRTPLSWATAREDDQWKETVITALADYSGAS